MTAVICVLGRSDPERFRKDLMNIARTTLGSKILAQHKDFFAELAVNAVLRLKSSGNLQAIQVLKVQGKTLRDSFLDEGLLPLRTACSILV